MLRASEITASAAAHGTSAMPGEAASPPGAGPFARVAHRRLTSARDELVYTELSPAAQRPSGPAAQRPTLRPAFPARLLPA